MLNVIQNKSRLLKVIKNKLSNLMFNRDFECLNDWESKEVKIQIKNHNKILK